MVEHQPSKLRVAGSSPVARFRQVEVDEEPVARVAQLVERILGKDEVRGSIPRASLDELEPATDGPAARRKRNPGQGKTWRRPNLSGRSRT